VVEVVEAVDRPMTMTMMKMIVTVAILKFQLLFPMNLMMMMYSI
jgi:hypothetical protein